MGVRRQSCVSVMTTAVAIPADWHGGGVMDEKIQRPSRRALVGSLTSLEANLFLGAFSHLTLSDTASGRLG